MKINVLQLKDASFRSRFSFWSNWEDICVYDYRCTPFLLQMSVNRFNKKCFKSIRITGSIAYRQAEAISIGDLTPTNPH